MSNLVAAFLIFLKLYVKNNLVLENSLSSGKVDKTSAEGLFVGHSYKTKHRSNVITRQTLNISLD